MEMIDIHSHVLPEVDDGAQDMEMTKQMISALYKQGVRILFATPHISLRSREDKMQRVMSAYEKVTQYVKENYPDLIVLLGYEIYMEAGMINRIKRETAITMNNTAYVLCEFQFGGAYRDMYELLQQLARARYKPIIAHVERYSCLQGEWERFRELREMGVLMQINAESLSGNIFDKRYRYGKMLIQSGVIDFVGSDTHDIKKRAPLLKQAEKTIVKLVGKEKAECILCKNAQVFLK